MGSLLVFWPHFVWTKSLMCKEVVNMDSTFQSIFTKSLCPVRTPDRQSSSVRTTYFSVRTLHCIEKLLFQLASVRTSISDRSTSDSFQVQNKGRLIHCPDDVVSRLDALINKARIAIQIPPSGRQSALVRTRAHQLRKLPIQLQLSGRLPLMVGTRVYQI
jgi:hypothetical protein